jgi:hypothetical protein
MEAPTKNKGENVLGGQVVQSAELKHDSWRSRKNTSIRLDTLDIAEVS